MCYNNGVIGEEHESNLLFEENKLRREVF